MLLSRDELITRLFQETDRAQRLKTGLAIILCGVDDWGTWLARLDRQLMAEVEREISARIVRVLRCYDVAGRYGDGEFGLVLPGCNSFNAVSMAERLSAIVFGAVLSADAQPVHLSACFGVAGSGGRSPLVVLRNAENALSEARVRGSGSIVRSSYDAEPDPATLLSPVVGF